MKEKVICQHYLNCPGVPGCKHSEPHEHGTLATECGTEMCITKQVTAKCLRYVSAETEKPILKEIREKGQKAFDEEMDEMYRSPELTPEQAEKLLDNVSGITNAMKGDIAEWMKEKDEQIDKVLNEVLVMLEKAKGVLDDIEVAKTEPVAQVGEKTSLKWKRVSFVGPIVTANEDDPCFPALIDGVMVWFNASDGIDVEKAHQELFTLMLTGSK